jgi:Cd2+/Zn2+-exporting ATPase
MQDEVHRFAITFFKKTRSKNTLTSILDDIERRGSRRKKVLLENFETIYDIKNTTQEKLKSLGIKTKMYTGDEKEIATNIANIVGIDEVYYELLPQDKFKLLETELSMKKGLIAFVGDGINDAPVLARADIGISMGGIGQASAIEASDIVIMTDSLERICRAIEISKKTNKIIKQNLIFAFTIKILALLLSTLGIATMWQAIFADVGVTLLTVINTLRILK